MDQNKTPVTIKEISKLANVSLATVSFVMNRKPGVGAETRERVLRIAEALDYKPNLMARSLVSGKTGLFGMLITSTKNPVFPELSEGVDQVLKAKGYSLSIISTNDDEAIEQKELSAAKARGFEGIITSSTLLNNRELHKLVSSGFPIISVLRRDYSCPDMDYVVANDTKGGYLAVEHLIRIGYERVAIVRGPQNTSTGIERFQGGIHAMEDYDIQPNPELIYDGDFFMDSGYAVAKKIMSLSKNKRPQAICSCNDEMAVGILEAFWEMGVRVPDEVALIGNNNTHVSSLSAISLSTISHKKKEMGRLAAIRLIERVENKNDKITPLQITLDPGLVARNTCGYMKSEEYRIERTKRYRFKF